MLLNRQFLPLQNIMIIPTNQLLFFTASSDIAVPASASATANVSALAPRNFWPGDGLECLNVNAAENNGAGSEFGP